MGKLTLPGLKDNESLKKDSVSDIKKYKVPSNIIRKIKENAPSEPYSDSYRRISGYIPDHNYEYSGYKCICIYVQNGLADKIDLFKEISKAIFNIQSEMIQNYLVNIFGFGDTYYLQHEHKYFNFRGLSTDWQNASNMTKIIPRISGDKRINPSIIPQLTSTKYIKSLYVPKTKIEKDDLLIIIGNKDEVFLNFELEETITKKVYKQILFVEIDINTVNYFYKYNKFLYKHAD